MATSWNIPALVNKIASDIPGLNTLLKALLKWDTSGTANIPTGAKRMTAVTGGKQLQQYDGASWGSTGKLMHDVDMLDGFHASQSQTAGTIPVRNANGAVPGNITGNAATATQASALANDYVVPVANGGTGANTEAGARQALGANNGSNITTGVVGTGVGGTGRTDGMVTDVMLADYSVSATSVGELGDAPVKNAVDVDTLVVPGVYHCTNATVALHYPSNGSNWFIQVFRSGNFLYQTAKQRGAGSIFVRYSTDSGASWYSWQPVDYRATSRINIYISKDGSDSNTGLSSDSPVLTVNAALRIAMGLDTSGTLSFCFGPGDWGNVTIYGAAFSAGAVLVTNYAGNTATSDPGNMPRFGVLALREGVFNIGNVEADLLYLYNSQILNQYYFIAGRVYLDRFSYLNLTNPCKIKFVSGQRNPCFQAGGQSILYLNSAVELENGLTNGIFLDAYRGAQLYIDNNFSYTGTFSGTKYDFRGDVAIAFHSSKSLDSLPGTGGSGECLLNGIPTKATALATARTIQTNLGSTDAASFDGSANASPGVTGVLPIANGGTGSATQNFVDLSSAQTIDGNKTFVKIPVVKTAVPALTLQQTDITKGTNPSADQFAYIHMVDSSGAAAVNRTGVLENKIEVSGLTSIWLRAYQFANGVTNNAALGIHCSADGNTKYATAPTPAAGDNSNKIATTEWFKNEKATTTDFGVGRSATDAEATAGATSGTGPAWVTPEQLAAGLEGKTDGKVTLKGTRTSSGDWSITGLVVNKPLFFLASASAAQTYVGLALLSGSDDGINPQQSGNSNINYWIGRGGNDISTNVFVVIPTATTVVIRAYFNSSSITLRAYQ